jgi:hypothetical protein
VDLDAEDHGSDRSDRNGDSEHRPRRARLAGNVEATSIPHERREERERDNRLLDIEPFRDVCASAPTRAAVIPSGGSTSRTMWSRSRMSGVSAETIPITPTAAADQASSDSGLGRRSRMRPG